MAFLHQNFLSQLLKIFKAQKHLKKNNKTVGIIVNPNSGKDIRRLVSSAFVIPQQYKSNELIKLYEGLSSQGVDKIYLMPDFSDVSKRAREKYAYFGNAGLCGTYRTNNQFGFGS